MAKILLVDDDQFLREINSDILTSEGHEITTAVDGEDALAKLKAGTFDLILMDVILPKLTGLDVAEQCSKTNKIMTPIIFLTNSDDPKDISRIHALGAAYAIKSNLTPPDLIALVKKNLQQA